MKRIIVVFVLVCMFAFCLTSCDRIDDVISDVMNLIPPKTADEVLERIGSKMDSLDSYSAQMTGNIKFYIDDSRTVADLSGNMVKIGDYYYSSSNFHIDRVSGDIDTGTLIVYDEGKMFLSNVSNNSRNNLCSAMSAEEFGDYIYGKDDDDINFADAENKTFLQNKDETWTIKMSGFGEEFLKILGVDEYLELFDAEIYDLDVTLNADSKFRALNIDMHFRFDIKEPVNVPELSFDISFSDYNSAEKIDIDKTEYTTVDDVRVITKFDEMLEDAYEYKHGKFRLEVEQTIVQGETTNTYRETDLVEYGDGEDGYYYDIYLDSDGTSMNLSYSDKKLTVSMGAESQSEFQTESEARQFVEYLINSAKYDSFYVSDVELNEDGTYTIELNPDESLYKGAVGPYQVFNVWQVITLKTNDDKISKIASEMQVETIGGPTITVKATVTFMEHN